MGSGQNRTDLQINALKKLDDAVALVQIRSYSNAYYISGYAIELGLKACIAEQISVETIPDKDIIKGILSHDFVALLGLAGLADEHKAMKKRDLRFAANWAIALQRSPDARYDSSGHDAARSLIEAISEPKSGILTWIKTYW